MSRMSNSSKLGIESSTKNSNDKPNSTSSKSVSTSFLLVIGSGEKNTRLTAPEPLNPCRDRMGLGTISLRKLTSGWLGVNISLVVTLLFFEQCALGGPHSTCRKWRGAESAQFSSRWDRCPGIFCLRISWLSIARISSLSSPSDLDRYTKLHTDGISQELYKATQVNHQLLCQHGYHLIIMLGSD